MFVIKCPLCTCIMSYLVNFHKHHEIYQEPPQEIQKFPSMVKKNGAMNRHKSRCRLCLGKLATIFRVAGRRYGVGTESQRELDLNSRRLHSVRETFFHHFSVVQNM